MIHTKLGDVIPATSKSEEVRPVTDALGKSGPSKEVASGRVGGSEPQVTDEEFRRRILSLKVQRHDLEKEVRELREQLLNLL
jgi:ribosomal protein S7